MQVLPSSQAPCPQTTAIPAVLHSCFTTAVMKKYCFRVREIKEVRNRNSPSDYYTYFITPFSLAPSKYSFKEVALSLKTQITMDYAGKVTKSVCNLLILFEN